MESNLNNISAKDRKKAQITIEQLLKEKIRKNQKSVKFKLVKSGEIISIPIQAYELLEKALIQIANGNSIQLIENEKDLSTQRTAEILNVSRPHVVKLLEEGHIPFIKVGSHRRIKQSDLFNYLQTRKSKRKKNLKQLTKQAQDLEFGYE